MSLPVLGREREVSVRNTQFAKGFLDLFEILKTSSLHLCHQPEVLLLQFLEVLVELVVPRVQDKDLEGEGGGCDYEVGDGETACD